MRGGAGVTNIDYEFAPVGRAKRDVRLLRHAIDDQRRQDANLGGAI